MASHLLSQTGIGFSSMAPALQTEAVRALTAAGGVQALTGSLSSQYQPVGPAVAALLDVFPKRFRTAASPATSADLGAASWAPYLPTGAGRTGHVRASASRSETGLGTADPFQSSDLIGGSSQHASCGLAGSRGGTASPSGRLAAGTAPRGLPPCPVAPATESAASSTWRLTPEQYGGCADCRCSRGPPLLQGLGTRWRPFGWAGAAAAEPPAQRQSYMTAALRDDIQASAVKKQTGVSLKYLLDFGTQPLERQMLLSARFLHAEIPIRLAHRLMDLNHLPPKLSEEPHVRRVKGWYAESFSDFRTFPAIKDNMDVVRFTAMLKNAFRRHNNVVPAIAKGVEEYKRELERTEESCQERENEIQHFLDTFFLSRIAIRFLAGHHISMFEPPRHDHIGLVHTKCSPFMVASDAVQEARAMCFREYGSAPSVTVLGNSDLKMAYVPSHLHHMVFELVKNSVRAVQERFSESDDEPPPIQVVVAEGLEDVTIKVSDQGGGIPRSGLQRIWTYLYTTARSPLPDLDIDSTNMPAVLAGYGCGLPLSRLYARYFGGDLQIISMEGYGTDAYLHLARLGNDEEPLPGAV